MPEDEPYRQFSVTEYKADSRKWPEVRPDRKVGEMMTVTAHNTEGLQTHLFGSGHQVFSTLRKTHLLNHPGSFTFKGFQEERGKNAMCLPSCKGPIH